MSAMELHVYQNIIVSLHKQKANKCQRVTMNYKSTKLCKSTNYAKKHQINKGKSECHEFRLRGHSLSWGLFGNTTLPQIVFYDNFFDNFVNVFKIHVMIALMCMLRDL